MPCKMALNLLCENVTSSFTGLWLSRFIARALRYHSEILRLHVEAYCPQFQRMHMVVGEKHHDRMEVVLARPSKLWM